MSKKKQWTTEELRVLVRNRYKDPGAYVVLEEVSSGTGWRGRGWVDMAVFNMWPSKGLTRRAFELKVSRSDFTRHISIDVRFAVTSILCGCLSYVSVCNAGFGIAPLPFPNRCGARFVLGYSVAQVHLACNAYSMRFRKRSRQRITIATPKTTRG